MLCRFCHLSREDHAQHGFPNTNRQKHEFAGDGLRRRMKPFTPSPQKSQAPLAIPLMLPKPAPMPMPLMLPVPSVPAVSSAPGAVGKPTSKEQAGLCELLSSLAPTPEERAGSRGYLQDPTRGPSGPVAPGLQQQ